LKLWSKVSLRFLMYRIPCCETMWEVVVVEVVVVEVVVEEVVVEEVVVEEVVVV